MNRENFIDMFNDLIKRYRSKTTFETDDYYNQVRYLPDHVLDNLRVKIIESCDYLPKPAELKKIAREFKTPYQKPDPPDINYDNCIKHPDKPVYKSLVDPYACKKCYEEKLEYLRKTKSPDLERYENGPLAIVETMENGPLIKTLFSLCEKYGIEKPEIVRHLQNKS